jgi:hypothetical protein
MARGSYRPRRERVDESAHFRRDRVTHASRIDA